jgi:hypothetical protein
MIKRSILSAILILFTACGSGSGGDKNNTTIEDLENGINRIGEINNSNDIDVPDINTSNINTEPNIPELNDLNISEPTIKKGFYVDGAVEGVNYDCGTQRGVTDSNGTFTFEDGKTCTFTLAGIVLRELNTTNLENNVVILEDNIENARLLQTLDIDGNSDNGIQLTKDVLDELTKSGIDSLPASNEELNRLFENLQNVEGYNGALVSIEEAKAHLKETIEELGLDKYLDQFPTEDEIDSVGDDMDSLFNGI